MIRRLLIIICVLFFPASSLAASASAPDTATQSLGPQSSNTGASSSADGTTLQPAGTSTLQQSVNSGTSSVLGGSSAQTLESPDLSQTQLQVISSGADGGPQSVGGSSVSMLDLVGLSILIGAVVAFAGWFYGTHPHLFRRRDQGD